MSNISPFKHDISHCPGSDVRLMPFGGTEICECSLRNSCYRYQAYCDPARPAIISCILPLECMDDNHCLYCETKNI